LYIDIREAQTPATTTHACRDWPCVQQRNENHVSDATLPLAMAIMFTAQQAAGRRDTLSS